MPQSTDKQGHIRAIDGLRAIAVLAVVIFHARSAILPGGFLGVDVFFVISGFVVPLSMMEQRFASRRAFALSFYSRRFLRLFPALVFWVLVSSVLTVLVVPRMLESGDFAVTGITALAGLSNVHLFTTSSDYFAAGTELNPFTQTWSLGVEEQFYILFSLLVACLGCHRKGLAGSRLARGTILAAGIASLAAGLYLGPRAPAHAFYLIDARLWQLALGMGLALTIARWRAAAVRISAAGGGIAAIAALAVLLVSLTMRVRGPLLLPHALPASIATALLIALVAADDAQPVARWLGSPIMVAIGRASYSIYLAHWPLMVTARWTIGLDAWPVQLLATVLSLACGFASYRLIERPARAPAAGRRVQPGQVVPGGMVLMLVTGTAVYGLFALSGPISLSRTNDAVVWSGYYDADVVARTCGLSTHAPAGFAAAGESVSIDVARCDRRGVAGRRLFVAGDSHAGAFRRMLTTVAAMARMPVTIYSRGGCPLFDLRSPNRRAGSCADFTGAALAALRARARPGDIVLLASLRVPKPLDKLGLPILPSAPGRESDPASDRASDRATRSRAMIEADAFLRELTARGVKVIVNAPPPVAHAPAFRCLDWFNRGNPACSRGFATTRDEQEAYRAVVMRRLADLARIPGVTIWDPMDTLCRARRCDTVSGNVPLLYDGTHVTGAADDLLAPAFVRVLQSIAVRGP